MICCLGFVSIQIDRHSQNLSVISEKWCYLWQDKKSQGNVSSGAKAVGSGVKEAVSSLKEWRDGKVNEAEPSRRGSDALTSLLLGQFSHRRFLFLQAWRRNQLPSQQQGQNFQKTWGSNGVGKPPCISQDTTCVSTWEKLDKKASWKS